MSPRLASSFVLAVACAGCTLREPSAAPPPMLPSDASLVAWAARPRGDGQATSRPRLARTVRIGQGEDGDDVYDRQVGDPRASVAYVPSSPPFSTLSPSFGHPYGYGYGYGAYGPRGASRGAFGASRGPVPGTPGVAGDWEKPADHGPTFPTPSAAGVTR